MTVVAFEDKLIEKRIADAIAADEAGDLHRALALTKDVIRRRPDEARANALAAVFSAMLDRYRQALIYASKSLACEGVDSEIAYWAAVARHICGAQQLALEALDLALVLDPHDEQARQLAQRCREQTA